MAEMYMGFGQQGGSVSNELHMIGWLCGYYDEPSDIHLEELIKKCISHGPYGYGLALFALYFVINGSVPYHTFTPIPFGLVGRIEKMYIVDGATLNKHGIIDDLGFYTMTSKYSIDSKENPDKMYEYIYPNVFAVLIMYRDMEDRLNTRAIIVMQTHNKADPFMAVLADDTTTEKILEIIRSNDYFRIPEDIIRHGVLIDKKAVETEKNAVDNIPPLSMDEDISEYTSDDAVPQ